jgi:hypothetical protein
LVETGPKAEGIHMAAWLGVVELMEVLTAADLPIISEGIRFVADVR